MRGISHLLSNSGNIVNKEQLISTVRVWLSAIVLVASTNTGLWAKPAEANMVTDLASVQEQIDKSVKPTPNPKWDELIKPQLIRAEEQRVAAAKAAEEARLAAEAARIEAERIEQARLARLPKPFGTYLNGYAFGNCTYYVASRKQVPGHWGNAGTWFGYARAEGWAVGSSPQVGAIAQTTVGYYGHVALVEAVEGNQVLVSEMNYAGFNVISQRWASVWEFNYIY